MNKIENSENKSLTIKVLFEEAKAIRIPAYQRAYIWENKHCLQFLDDLKEQQGKPYYLGQLLFEKEGITYFIIDGQQRLTTTVLFLSALFKVYLTKKHNKNKIKELYLNDKFRTIEDDQVLFKKCTQKHLISRIDDTETISQKRIIEAYKFFEEELIKLDLQELIKVQKSLEYAVISTFFITNKVEATQIFEYQNNRGKDLTQFEVIKAYLMNQIYINSDDLDTATSIINDIQSIVAKTYRNIEATESYFTESELLNNYTFLFFGIAGNIETIKEKLKKENDKVYWIKDFFDGFVDLTSSAKTIVKHKKNPLISNLFFLGNEANWKIVLITFFYKGENTGEKFNQILKLLEILIFKLKLGDFRTDYLPNFSKKYFNEVDGYKIENFLKNIEDSAVNGFKWYWNNNDNFKNIISNYFENNNYHYEINIIKYVLWQYENDLRMINKSGALLDKELYDNYTIEHIKPQTPSKTGIEYSEDFKKNYLHKSGNLALLTQSQNSKFRNKSFEKKKELFKDTALTSYSEIRENESWNEKEIDERHSNILRFIKKHFNIEVECEEEKLV